MGNLAPSTPETIERGDLRQVITVNRYQLKDKAFTGIAEDDTVNKLIRDINNPRAPLRTRIMARLDLLRQGLEPMDKIDQVQVTNNTQVNNYILAPDAASELLARLPEHRARRASLITQPIPDTLSATDVIPSDTEHHAIEHPATTGTVPPAPPEEGHGGA